MTRKKAAPRIMSGGRHFFSTIYFLLPTEAIKLRDDLILYYGVAADLIASFASDLIAQSKKSLANFCDPRNLFPYYGVSRIISLVSRL